MRVARSAPDQGRTKRTSACIAYDPAFMNTASCRSSITYLDGDAGVLQYRGYPIEQLAEQLDLPGGRLPARPRRAADEGAARGVDAPDHDPHLRPREHQGLHPGLPPRRPPDGDAARRGRRAVDLLSRRESRSTTPRTATIQIIRLIAKMPTLAAFSYRHNMGMPYVYPDNDLNYAGNFLGMLYKMTELKYRPDPRIERALDVLFILHADHEQNCSTSAVRAIGSLAGRPLLGDRRRESPRSTAPRTAAPTRRSCGCCTGSGPREHPRLHRRREGRQRATDGLRPPRLQELRPARADHQEAPATTSSR